MLHYNQRYESVPSTPAGTPQTWSPTSKIRTCSLTRRTALMACGLLIFFFVYHLLFPYPNHQVRPHPQCSPIIWIDNLCSNAVQTISQAQSYTMLPLSPMPLSNLPNRYHIATLTRLTHFHPTSTATPATSRRWTSTRHSLPYAQTASP